MKRSKKKLFALLLVIVVFFTSCNAGVSEDTSVGYKTDVIKIQYSTSLSSAIPHFFMMTGRLEDVLPEGVTVEWVNVDGASNNRDALVTGRTDIAFMVETAVITALENDYPFVILSGSYMQSAKMYSNRPEIRNLDDIKESDKISTATIGNNLHLALMIHSKEKYGDANKFNNNLVAMSNSDVLASLATSDDLSCSFLGFPYVKIAEEMEGLVPILDLTPIINDYRLGTFTVTRQDFYDENPVLIEIVIKAISEAIDYMNEQPTETAKILAEFSGVTGYENYEAELKASPLVLEIPESSYDTVADIMYESGMIPNPPKKFSELPNYDSIPKTK